MPRFDTVHSRIVCALQLAGAGALIGLAAAFITAASIAVTNVVFWTDQPIGINLAPALVLAVWGAVAGLVMD